jgi:glutaminyl-peptide cyclotransferase
MPSYNDSMPKMRPKPPHRGTWVVGGFLMLGLIAMAENHYSQQPASAQDKSNVTASSNDAANSKDAGTAASPVSSSQTASGRSRPKNPLNGQRAFGYLRQICDIGPRQSGSPGMQKQQELVQKHFEQLGGKVTMQRFQAKNPLGGSNVPMANVIVQWHPDRKQRVLVCAHYDTRPLPDRDPDPAQQRQGVFIGANDGASGVAVLMELAHLLPELDGDIGVDFALFDGEELVYVEGRDPYFLGSTWFAQQYVRQPPEYKYRWGVLLDMVGDSNLQLYQEQHGVTWRDTRPLVKEIWATAARLGVKEFVPRARYKILDDHVPLRNIGKIPTCDIIDYDYIYWHTTMDTPQRCSPSSLAKVGWVVYEWLKTQK